MYDSDCNTCKVSRNVDDFEGQENRSFDQQQKVNTKLRKICLLMSTSELVNLFDGQIVVLRKHIYVKREQHKLSS